MSSAARIGRTVLKGGGESVGFRCPGCKTNHWFNVGAGTDPGHRWAWNGNEVAPSFTPSLFVKTVRITGANREAYDELRGNAEISAAIEDPRFRWWCHSVITDGRIAFQNDCSHELASQTVDVPLWRRA